MTLRRLKWGFLATLAVVLLVLELARYRLGDLSDTPGGRLLLAAALIVAIVLLFAVFYGRTRAMQERLERQNRELVALRRAGLDLHGELSLDAVLQKVVEQARSLLSARYGALAVIDQEGQIQQFLTSGLDPETVAQIGDTPRGKGLLGLMIHEGQKLRIEDVSRDSRAAGFPAHHPQIRSLLAVPIVCESPFRGNLYVADRQGDGGFEDEDEVTLERFAFEAAIAIDNSYVHRRLENLAVAEERLRIGREMHDGMAQVLAYVNTKAQAAREFLKQERNEETDQQLEQLAAASREVYTDVREGILALRTQPGPERSLRKALEHFIEHWQLQSGIRAEFRLDDDLELAPAVELQLLRIVQEALANVRKHSKAERAQIEIGQADGKLLAEVADDGKGFDPDEPQPWSFPRFGLSVMRERAQSVGGTLQMDSTPGGGTRIRVVIPIS